MRDWRHEVRAHLERSGGTGDVEEIAQHIADVHRAALFSGRSMAEADDTAFQEIARLTPASLRRPGPPPRRGGWFGGVAADLRQAARLLRNRPGYTAVVVLTLAVGIGGCAAVYSLFNALLRAPLPFPAPDRLVLVWEANAQDLTQHSNVAAPNYRDWRDAASSFAALGLYQNASFNLAADGQPERLSGVRASSSFFDVLAVPPALGRAFTATEELDAAPVAVISDAVWKKHFAADPGVLGRSIRLNGAVHTVIGVMPEGFAFPSPLAAVWVPVVLTADEQRRDWHSFVAIGRLGPSVSFMQAKDEIERIGERLRHRDPDHTGHGATLELMAEVGLADSEEMLAALGGAVAMVLLIACVNVAGLQLALGFARQREFATRLSLGARYSHLVRQLLTESALIAALGCLAGLAITFVAIRAFDLLLPPGYRTVPFRGEVAVTLDFRVLAVAIASAFGAAVMFVLPPLRAAKREALQPALRAGDRGTTHANARTRRVLVAAEIALAIVVLTAAGLVFRSLSLVLQQTPGLDPSNVLAIDVSVPQTDPFGPADRQGFCGDVLRETTSLPGVTRASAVDYLPLAGGNANRIFTSEDGVQARADELLSAEFRVVCPGYFETLAIPMVAGRDVSDRDHAESPRVVVVNRAFAENYLPGNGAVGRRLKLGRSDSADAWMTIVGVVENVRHFGLEAPAAPEIYVPYPQVASPAMTVVAKTSSEPLAWESAVRAAIRRVDPAFPAANARTMEQVISESVRWRETPMRLLIVFAVVGLLLAGMGVYSVLAFYVSQRIREFGVRVALGASKTQIVRLVLQQSLLPLAAGVALGIGGSLVSGQLLSSLLFDVQPGDPTVLTVIVVLLVTVTIASGWLPARRAAAVDPLVALRDE